jgi:hypothetical protein
MNATIRLGLSSVLLMVAGGLSAYAPAAFAQTSQIRNVGITGRCLTYVDLGGTSHYARNATCNAGDAKQIWTQVPVGGGYFLLKNVATGRCLASAQTAQGLNIRACDPTLWTHQWQRTATGTTFFKSRAAGRYLFALAGGGVGISVSTGSVQTWQY